MESEASKLLEAALVQMDGIIQGAKFELCPSLPLSPDPLISVENALKNLKVAIEVSDEKICESSRRFLLNILKMSDTSCCSEIKERVQELEMCNLELVRENRELKKSLEVLSPNKGGSGSGIKKIWGKMRRSNSGSDLGTSSPFRRESKSRATLPGRPHKQLDSLCSFADWTPEYLSIWMESLGLSTYVPSLVANIQNGEALRDLPLSAYESQLGIKNPLIVKKLHYALTAQKGPSCFREEAMDHSSVLQWLDDIGLPQYKDSFAESLVDGRVLNRLSFEDLSTLKVHNLLHIFSLKWGIYVLRSLQFDVSQLQRRQNKLNRVYLWSNHRVMEWLKEVDLSEYAPNLRGSGVHGGLLYYEPRFNDECFSSILSISTNKTLLRRHLSCRFKELVGPEIMSQKRNTEEDPTYSPLTPGSKAKYRSSSVSSQFSLKRKKSKNIHDEDLLCPLNTTTTTNISSP